MRGISNDFHNRTDCLSSVLEFQIQTPRRLVASEIKAVPLLVEDSSAARPAIEKKTGSKKFKLHQQKPSLNRF
jgi:hypothetical protein